MQTDKKFTPGPWKVCEPNLPEKNSIGVRPMEDGYIICDINDDAYDEEENKANAELIASAPALLEENINLRAEVDRLTKEKGELQERLMSVIRHGLIEKDGYNQVLNEIHSTLTRIK